MYNLRQTYPKYMNPSGASPGILFQLDVADKPNNADADNTLFLYFLNSFLVFFEDHIGNKCAIVCFNVSILGKYYIYMYYNVLPNKLTHSHATYMLVN